MVVRDIYLQPDAPDPVLDEEVVLYLVRRHVAGEHAVTGVDESGGEARTYAVAGPEGELILKTQRPHRVRPRTSLEKEALFLRHLAATYQDAPLPVPRVFGYGREGLLEYIVMSRVPGVSASGAPIAGPARSAALRALAGVLLRVHHVPQAPLQASGLFPGDRTPTDFAARVDQSIIMAGEAIQQAGVTWPFGRTPAEVAAATALAVPHMTNLTMVALHSNPGPVHTFVDLDTFAFTGLIDFGDAYVSHPAFDLVRWPDPGDRETLLAAYATAADDKIVDETFVAIWHVASLLADLQLVARQPERAPQLTDQLQRSLDALRGA